MEIEAKFVIPNAETYQRLQALEVVAGMTLAPGHVRHVHDIYLDTVDRAILAAGYACRRREQDDGVSITLKGLMRTEGAIHRREELEAVLTKDLPPKNWPASPARDRLLELAGDAQLMPLFDLRQIRNVRPLMSKGKPVAEMYLDEVTLEMEDRRQAYYELEVELADGESEEVLVEIVASLKNEWGLPSEPRSKFERALIFIGESSPNEEQLLTAEERVACLQLANRDDLHGRRAVALLALDDGALQREAGEKSGMSIRRVRYWLGEFRKQRLGVFPPRVLRSASAEPDEDLVLDGWKKVPASGRSAPSLASGSPF